MSYDWSRTKESQNYSDTFNFSYKENGVKKTFELPCDIKFSRIERTINDDDYHRVEGWTSYHDLDYELDFVENLDYIAEGIMEKMYEEDPEGLPIIWLRWIFDLENIKIQSKWKDGKPSFTYTINKEYVEEKEYNDSNIKYKKDKNGNITIEVIWKDKKIEIKNEEFERITKEVVDWLNEIPFLIHY